jgi:hypothetical protein
MVKFNGFVKNKILGFLPSLKVKGRKYGDPSVENKGGRSYIYDRPPLKLIYSVLGCLEPLRHELLHFDPNKHQRTKPKTDSQLRTAQQMCPKETPQVGHIDQRHL